MTSSISLSNRLRNARAPVPFLCACVASSFRASALNSRSTPSMAISLVYCLVSAFFGSVKIETNCSSVNCCSTVTTGKRPTNSGMKPKEIKSSGSMYCRTSWRLTSAIFWLFSTAPKPITRLPSRRCTIFSSPTNAPPQMNRMPLVLTRIYSCCGCFRPPCGGTLQTVPSRILSRACCTPSPETSRVRDTFSVLRAILSISSI